MNGVLLCNLGTPEAPTPRAVRAFLKEFLSDRRVVDLPRVVWLPVLYGFVLRTRPAEVAHKYRAIWTDAGSPLRAIGERQALALQQRLGDGHRVELAMRYGTPPIAGALAELVDRGVDRVTVLPLYPQYSVSTTASVFDAVTAALKRIPRLPEMTFIRSYHDHPAYLDALAQSVRDDWDRRGRGERLLMSFHGVPERYVGNGDPYLAECTRTARLLAGRLGLADGDWQMSFQSRFGKAKWIEPFTDATLARWARDGVRRADVICPGFAADCLETLEEIALLNRRLFRDAGGDELHYIPALNDRPDHIAALAQLVQ